MPGSRVVTNTTYCESSDTISVWLNLQKDGERESMERERERAQSQMNTDKLESS